MPNITKIELTQVNTRLAAENAELRARVSQLEADLARVRTQGPSHPNAILAKREAAKRYFEANPNAKSCTPADLAPYMQ